MLFVAGLVWIDLGWFRCLVCLVGWLLVCMFVWLAGCLMGVVFCVVSRCLFCLFNLCVCVLLVWGDWGLVSLSGSREGKHICACFFFQWDSPCHPFAQEYVLFSPVGFWRESITTGHILLFFPGLKHMEVVGWTTRRRP